MQHYLVDTNVILDIVGADHQFGEASKDCLARCASNGVLVINPVIFAEVGALIDSIEEMDRLFPPALFRRDPLPWEASYIAGQALRRYRQRGGKRERVLADFLIGAHAAQAEMKLVSRDQGYASYFKVTILDPTEF